MKSDDGIPWQVVMDPGNAANFLLFVRDTHKLSPAGSDGPPRLTAAIDRLSEELGESDLAQIEEAWLAWWRGFIHLEGRIQIGDRVGTPRIEQEFLLAIVRLIVRPSIRPDLNAYRLTRDCKTPLQEPGRDLMRGIEPTNRTAPY